MAIQQGQSQNALAQQQLAAGTRAVSDSNAMREIYANALDPATGAIDQNKLLGAMGAKGQGHQIPATLKSLNEQQTAALTRQKTEQEVIKAKLANHLEKTNQAVRDITTFQSVGDVVASIKKHFDAGDIDEPIAQKLMADIPPSDAELPKWQMAHLRNLLDTKEQLENHFQTLDSGGASKVVAIPKFGGGPAVDIAGTQVAKVATPGETLSASTQRRGQDITAGTAATRLAFDKDLPVQEALAGAKATGTKTAEAKVAAKEALPGVIQAAEQGLKAVDELVGKAPDAQGKGGTKPAPGFGQAVGAGVPGLKYFPGSSVADFNKRLEQIQGGAFMDAYKSLKGGGSITEVEGAKGTAAINRMSTAQSEKEFIAAARDFQDVLREGVRIARVKAATVNPHAGKTDDEIKKALGL